MNWKAKAEPFRSDEDWRRRSLDYLIASWMSAGVKESAGRRFLRHRKLRFKKAIVLLLVAAPLLGGLLSSSLWSDLVGGYSCGGPAEAYSSGEGRIAIIDQLASYYPNPRFVMGIEALAKNSGYGFDYYPPEASALDLFLNLPRMGYSMVILRTHGTGSWPGDSSAITVSDSYSQYRRVGDQLQDKLAAVDVNGSLHFGLLPDFISKVACGRFESSLVLAMGCGTMVGTELAEAFIEKGARAFIGWTGLVTLSHTDRVFESLVQFILEGNTIHRSVEHVMERLGPDPSTGASLSYFPRT